MNPYLTFKSSSARIIVEIFKNTWSSIDCLIDTGFSGGIALPHDFIQRPSESPLSYEEYELANGSDVLFEIYEISVRYKTIEKNVKLIFTKSNEGIVGMEFLQDFRFLLDLKQNIVSLE